MWWWLNNFYMRIDFFYKNMRIKVQPWTSPILNSIFSTYCHNSLLQLAIRYWCYLISDGKSVVLKKSIKKQYKFPCIYLNNVCFFTWYFKKKKKVLTRYIKIYFCEQTFFYIKRSNKNFLLKSHFLCF